MTKLEKTLVGVGIIAALVSSKAEISAGSTENSSLTRSYHGPSKSATITEKEADKPKNIYLNYSYGQTFWLSA